MANFIKTVNFNYMRDNLLRDTARMAAVESVKFFKESFVKGGFTDTSLKSWSKGSGLFMSDGNGGLAAKRGSKTMYAQGTLMQSVKATEQSNSRVVVTSDTPYSAIHNDGGTITVTAQMKKWWWAQYYKFAKVEKAKTKSGGYSKSKKNAIIDKRAEFCKRMALMPVGAKIKIPQRQFMGESKQLMSELDSKLQTKIAEYWEKA